jgi:hypothetical protein
MTSTKLAIAVLILVAVLFAVGIFKGMSEKPAPKGSKDSDQAQDLQSNGTTRNMSCYQDLLYPLTPKATFSQKDFKSGQTITDQPAERSSSSFRMAKFYRKEAQCHFEITYLPPSDCGISPDPKKPIELPPLRGDANLKSGAVVTLLKPGGTLHFQCVAHRPPRPTCVVTLTEPSP